ncbi:hypothetical protein [Flavobacterium sp.]|uniref:hypothetical protein n=1 Tax=Flavobacterium sp. TaxID=239 RepID=UPI0028BD4B71|nr:hypothetical protein [Flavobacterium sp.]
MKKIILSLLFFSSLAVNAQISTATGGASNVLPNSPVTNTNVGIGTDDPRFKLTVGGSLPDGQTFSSQQEELQKSMIFSAGAVKDATNKTRLLNFFDFPASNYKAKSSFWFSIEDRADNARLTMSAYTDGFGMFKLYNKSQDGIFHVSNDGDFVLSEFPKPDSHFIIGGTQAYPIEHSFWVKTGTSKFEGDVFVNTNLGIGTTNFVDGANTYRLSVKGKIRADEVKVYNTWADYVFADDYKLKSLNEVEKYIQTNGHLPNVPSAKEVTENGLELGEMSKIQQEKIEELTLYLIEQNKEIEQLKEQVKLLLEKK